MSVKLTDAQLVMMSAGAQRKDRCLSAPATIKGAAIIKVSAKLAKLGLVREIEAKPGAPIWRRDDAGQGYALKLTAAGLKAIAVDEGSPEAIGPGEGPQPEAKNGASLDEGGHPARAAAPRDGSKLALVIELLRRADGATIIDLTQAMGWLPHTTRAALHRLSRPPRETATGRVSCSGKGSRTAHHLPEEPVEPRSLASAVALVFPLRCRPTCFWLFVE
jgi:hypothetical protein